MTEGEVERALGVPGGLYSIQYTPDSEDFEYDPAIFSRDGKNGEWRPVLANAADTREPRRRQFNHSENCREQVAAFVNEMGGESGEFV